MGDRYRQRQLFEATPSLAWEKAEDQWFDRKSYRVSPVELARHLIGFANAEGGTIVVGVENDRRVTGMDAYTEQENGLRQAALDHTEPPVRHTADLIECVDNIGTPNHLLVFEVHPSDEVHQDTAGHVHLRIGDQTRRLNPEQARELAFDKGVSNYDVTVIPMASAADLDESATLSFAKAVGLGSEARQALRARGLLVGPDAHVSCAAVLMFGSLPQAFLPNASIRVLRYEGIRPATGTRSNVVFDRRLEGTIPSQIEQTEQVMLNQLRYLTRLDERSGRFVTIPEVPRFAWLEAIVNAVTHRSYSLQGDHVRVSLFDDRVVVESPGRLPGPVRIDNIRETRFSRNPRIARVLADLGIVRELNEGMKRIYEEMVLAGLPEPQLEQTESGFRVTLFNRPESERHFVEQLLTEVPPGFAPAVQHLLNQGDITTASAAEMTGYSRQYVRTRMQELEADGFVRRVGRSVNDPSSFWELSIVLRARWRT